jgi:hypothetical protein
MTAQIQDHVTDIQQLFAHEAMLLDEGRYDEWLELFTEDVAYVMPVPVNRTKNFRPPERQLNLLEETLTSLRTRAARAKMDTAWSEHPRSRTVRMVTNVLVRGDQQRRTGGSERLPHLPAQAGRRGGDLRRGTATTYCPLPEATAGEFSIASFTSRPTPYPARISASSSAHSLGHGSLPWVLSRHPADRRPTPVSGRPR